MTAYVAMPGRSSAGRGISSNEIALLGMAVLHLQVPTALHRAAM